MLQSPPLASMLPFHHAMQVAAVQAAQHHHQQQQQQQQRQESATSVTSVASSSPSNVTSVAAPLNNGLVGHHPPQPHGPHPFHAGLPPHHGGHFHPHLGMEPPRPRFLFKMPRVVPNQKEKYETDDLMKRHSREGEVRYTGYRDRPLHERQTKFICALREGHSEIAFIATGFNVMLTFDPTPAFNPAHRQCDYEKEPGKVHIRSPFILNGVCVRWKGYMDLERLDGVGCIEFDEETANLEDAIMRDTVEAYNRRIKDFEEHTKARSRQLAAFMGHQQQMAAALQAQQHLAASGHPPLVTSPTNNNLISSSTTCTTASSANTNCSSSSIVSHRHLSATSPPSSDPFEARKKQLHDLSSNSSSSPPTSSSVRTS